MTGEIVSFIISCLWSPALFHKSEACIVPIFARFKQRHVQLGFIQPARAFERPDQHVQVFRGYDVMKRSQMNEQGENVAGPSPLIASEEGSPTVALKFGMHSRTRARSPGSPFCLFLSLFLSHWNSDARTARQKCQSVSQP